MTEREWRRRVSAYVSLLVGVVMLAGASTYLDGWLLAPMAVGGALALFNAVVLLAEGPRVDPPAAEDFGQHEPELDALRNVYDLAYRWRYDLAANGTPSDAATEALIEAVDRWDIDRPHHEQGGPIR